MTPRIVRHTIGIATLCILVAGCLTGSSNPLVGKGPLPLSATNPFLGANQFLGEQLSQGRSIRELFVQRGGPDAIELINRNSFQLIYLRYQQTYFADSIDTGAGNNDWMIRGPFTLSRRQFLTVRKLGIFPGAAPIFLVNGRLTNFQLPPQPTPTPTVSSRPNRAQNSHKPQKKRAPKSSKRVVIRAPRNQPIRPAVPVIASSSGAVIREPITGTYTPNSDQRALSATRPTPIPIEALQPLVQQGLTPTATPVPTVAQETTSKAAETSDKKSH
jgi:hypothetical protein